MAAIERGTDASAGTFSKTEEGEMGSLLPVLFWGGPVGLGIFFIGLGVLLWGVSKVTEAGKKI